MTAVSAIPPTSQLLAAFVHPGLAAAALGLTALPIIIHLWNRRRSRPMPWAAMRFLEAAYRRSTRRIKLEQYLLLAMRCLIVALFGLAIARPLAAVTSGWLGRGAGRHHILILDDSLSTRADRDGQPAFDDLVAAARRLVNALPTQDNVSLFTTTQPDRVLVRSSQDRLRINEILDGLAPTHRADDLAATFAQATALLDNAGRSDAETSITLLTDGTQSSWTGGAAEASAAPWRAAAQQLADRCPITLVVARPDDEDNVAVTDVAVRERALVPGLPTEISVRVDNFGRKPTNAATLQLLRDGQLVGSADVPALSPGASRAFPFGLSQDAARDAVIEAVLTGDVDDALAVDNRRLFCKASPERRRILLVDASAAARTNDSSYLDAALSPFLQSDGGDSISVSRLRADQLADEPLRDVGAIVLANVRRLEPATWRRIKSAVAEGTALLIFAGDDMDIEDYQAAAADLLPGALESPVGDANDSETLVRISAEGLSHPAAAGFANDPDCSLFQAFVQRYLRVSPNADAGARIVFRFDNDAPAIVERPVGEGVVLLCTVPADMGWSNLPAKGDFVSLIWDLLTYAWPAPRFPRTVDAGRPIALPLSAADADAGPTVARPDGESAPARVTLDDDRFIATFDDTDAPGEYRMHVADRIARFVVNPDRAESDLSPISEARLRTLLGESITFVDDPAASLFDATPAESRALSGRLLLAVLALLLAESFLSMRFGHHR